MARVAFGNFNRLVIFFLSKHFGFPGRFVFLCGGGGGRGGSFVVLRGGGEVGEEVWFLYCRGSFYSRTPVTRTRKENEKQIKLAGNLSYTPPPFLPSAVSPHFFALFSHYGAWSQAIECRDKRLTHLYPINRRSTYKNKKYPA